MESNEDDILLEVAPSTVRVLQQVPSQSTATLNVTQQSGNMVTVQGDQYFGTQGVSANAVAEDEDVIIRCDNIHKTYLLGIEGVPALRGVSLTIKRGEFVCIFGTSGGGKTTMLNVLGTIDKPTRGYLHICGTKVSASTPDSVLSELRLLKLGFVFQTFNLLSALTALENVEMPMILAGKLTAEERRARAKQLLTAVGMEKRLDHVPSQMSGGEQQRVTIARAISNSPDILLLDEPTGDLDTANTLRVMQMLIDLNKGRGIAEGKPPTTLVLVTHDVGLKYFADRVLWMRDGKLQRVEIISETKRAEMTANLQREVEALRAPIGTVGARANSENPFANTKLRQPTHYECIRGMQEMQKAKAETPREEVLKWGNANKEDISTMY